MSAVTGLTDEWDRLSVTPFNFEPVPMTSFYSWPSTAWSQLKRLGKTAETAKSSVSKDGYMVCMDVANFGPSELSVTVVDESIVVVGKHEEREDEHGYISRQFVRRYILPQGYEEEADGLVATQSTDGVLTLSIPKPQHGAAATAAGQRTKQQRVVAIEQTGVPHVLDKEED